MLISEHGGDLGWAERRVTLIKTLKNDSEVQKIAGVRESKLAPCREFGIAGCWFLSGAGCVLGQDFSTLQPSGKKL